MYLKNIKMEFGLEAFRITREWINTNQLFREQNHGKEFLLQCRGINVMPKFIKNNLVGTNRFYFFNMFVCNFSKNLIPKY